MKKYLIVITVLLFIGTGCANQREMQDKYQGLKGDALYEAIKKDWRPVAPTEKDLIVHDGWGIDSGEDTADIPFERFVFHENNVCWTDTDNKKCTWHLDGTTVKIQSIVSGKLIEFNNVYVDFSGMLHVTYHSKELVFGQLVKTITGP